MSLLLEKLEEAKIAEAREAPAVQVIDKARPSRYTAGPTASEGLTFAFCGSLVGAILLCLSLEYFASFREWRSRRQRSREMPTRKSPTLAIPTREKAADRENAGSSQTLIRGHRCYKTQKTYRLTKKEKIRSN